MTPFIAFRISLLSTLMWKVEKLAKHLNIRTKHNAPYDIILHKLCNKVLQSEKYF